MVQKTATIANECNMYSRESILLIEYYHILMSQSLKLDSNSFSPSKLCSPFSAVTSISTDIPWSFLYSLLNY